MESGFYYLQSRYYDPIVKRFLNADSYGSTGQGFLGYNMFAYCTNNPSNSIDIAGCISISIWPQLFKDLRYGFIHAIVAYHIVSASSFGNIDLAAECWILKGDTFVGRADVIDTATGEVQQLLDANILQIYKGE